MFAWYASVCLDFFHNLMPILLFSKLMGLSYEEYMNTDTNEMKDENLYIYYIFYNVFINVK